MKQEIMSVVDGKALEEREKGLDGPILEDGKLLGYFENNVISDSCPDVVLSLDKCIRDMVGSPHVRISQPHDARPYISYSYMYI